MSDDLPMALKSLLNGHSKLVVWGGTDDLLMREWQRQIKAEFLVDTRWEWWNERSFFGMPVFSPSEIGRLSPAKTLVSNNFYLSGENEKIKNYLARIGGYRTLDPMSLHEICQLAAQKDSKTYPSISGTKNYVTEINQALTSAITPPEKLGERKKLPGMRELMTLFNSYTRNDYLNDTLPILRAKSSGAFKPRRNHACLLIGGLYPGGAERQFCNLAIGLKRMGWSVTVLVYYANKQEASSYRKSLADEGIEIEVIMPAGGLDLQTGTLRNFVNIPKEIMLAIWHIRSDYALRVIAAYNAMRRLRPELAVCYLDNNNVTGGFGAALAGVPRIFLSGRSTARPHLLTPGHQAAHQSNREMYQLLSRQPGVFLSNNSPYGAQSYSEWLGLGQEKFSVVRNCVSEAFTKRISPRSIREQRTRMKLGKNDIFILGVFRLHPIKRPLDFVNVIAALHKKHPALRAAISGSFDQETDRVKKRIRDLKLENVLNLLGVIEDVPALMQMATLLLHTAEVEGSPNVILEAQAIGLPVVSTRTTGASICLHEDWKLLMKKPGDVSGLAAACDFLIGKPELMKRCAKKAKRYTRKHYSILSLTQNTLKASGLKY